MLQGIIVLRSANEQSKSAGVFPYLKLDNGDFIKIRKVKDNPFENDCLKEYEGKAVVLQGEYNENNTFMVTEISEVETNNVSTEAEETANVCIEGCAEEEKEVEGDLNETIE
ncbi:MAG: hypothetical protein J6R29_03240 [Clostridia bacterium]|nr:hypothetical protein [Clostridia bacterium]